MDLARSLAPPASGHAEYQDDSLPHLILRIAATGRRSWHYRAFWRGSLRREALGLLEIVNLATARAVVRQRDLEWSTGAGAEAVRSQRRQDTAPTVAEMWQRYMAAARITNRPKTIYEKETLWRLHISDLASMSVLDLSRAHVAAMHRAIGAAHQVAANRVLKVLRACCRWALAEGMIPADPTAGIRMYRETSRRRFLRPDERPAFLAALQEAPPDLRDYVVLSIATGARQRNILGMRWDDVDMALRVWYVEGRDAKAGDPLTVPLTPDALAVLESRRGGRRSPYVFPSSGKSSSPHVQSLKTSWRSLCARAGISDLHMHDLRRTLGSWMAIQGASLPMIGRALGHADPSSTAIYAQLTVDPVASAMAAASAAVLRPSDVPSGAQQHDQQHDHSRDGEPPE